VLICANVSTRSITRSSRIPTGTSASRTLNKSPMRAVCELARSAQSSSLILAFAERISCLIVRRPDRRSIIQMELRRFRMPEGVVMRFGGALAFQCFVRPATRRRANCGSASAKGD
jgi:hypothetical protein